MTAYISHTTFDALDPYRQAEFWSRVLGFVADPDDPNLPDDEERMIVSADRSQRLLFIRVPFLG